MTIECALSDEAQPRQQGRVVTEAQDREIVGRSGHPRSRIKAVCRADNRGAAQRRLANPSDQARKTRR
jgi:hypothetical protein